MIVDDLCVTIPWIVHRKLILDYSPPARYALMRLSESAAGQPLAQILFGLLASTWERKHANVYARAESLFHMVGQSDFPDGKLASLIATMTTTFIG
jgi:hypothetical protein